MPGAIESRDLMRTLVFAAASRLAGHQACVQLERAPSGPIVLGLLAGQVSNLDTLAGQGNAHWAQLIPQGLGKRRRRVAVAWAALPSHGTVAEVRQDERCRSKAQRGTPHFCTSATADAVVQSRRSTLAMGRVRATQPMDYGLRPLLLRWGTLGMRRKLLLLDRGCDRGRGIQDLLTGTLPCIMPAVKRGQKPPTAGGPTGTYALTAMQHGPSTPNTLKSSKEGPVDFALAVVCHHTRGY
jgi:hypothetical protein